MALHQTRAVLLAILLFMVVGCANAPTQDTTAPAQETQQSVPTPKATEVAVAIALDQQAEKLPVDELAQSGELDTIASIAPPAELADSTATGVAEEAESASVADAAEGQLEIESPGRAEPPRPEGSDDPNVRINFFRFAKVIEKPSEPTTIEWSVDGVESVQITRFGGQYGEAGEQWTVPASGSMQHTFPPTTAGFEVTYLLTSMESQTVAEQFNLTVPCEYGWAFDFRDPALLCPSKPVISDAAFQVFEGGVMVWLDDTDTIVYSNWDGSISAEVPDTYQHGTDDITDPLYTPPAGYYQPDYGLGKVWRTYPEARIALGWAITPNQSFQAIRQGEPIVPFGDIDEFISLPGDGYLHMQSDSAWGIQFNMPEFELADVRPAVSEASIPTPVPNTVQDGATVNFFRFAPPPSRPSDNVTLEWSVSGVNSLRIERRGGDQGEADASYSNLPPEGSIEQTFPPEVAGLPVVYTLTSDDVESMSLEFVINMPCEYVWAITDAYGDGCPTRPIISFGAQQDFENGFMIWIEEEGIIVYSTWDGQNHGVVPDNYQHGVDIVSNPNFVPPAGMYQPDYGFGKVWREEDGVRDLLGWGVSPTIDYEVRHQTSATDTATFVEIVTLNNGGRIVIEHPDLVWKIER